MSHPLTYYVYHNLNYHKSCTCGIYYILTNLSLYRIVSRLGSPKDFHARHHELWIVVVLDCRVPVGAHSLRMRGGARDRAVLRAKPNHHER